MVTVPFSQLPLSVELKKAVEEMGFEMPSPIQAEAIPLLVEGHDLIGQAQTGTGKTAAFGLPLLDAIDPSWRAVQALVMCPTRELAVQVAGEFKKFAKFKEGVRIECVYGGDPIERQIRSLERGAHIVVGTPGRLMDHLNRGTLSLDNCTRVVLDEADEMLDMGFRDDIEAILYQLAEERQTVFFSATMSPDIMNLTKKYQKNPQLVQIKHTLQTTPNIEQFYYNVRPQLKVEALGRLIEYYDLKLMLVFCNTKRQVDQLTEALAAKGYNAEALHGDLRQNQRNNVMAKFRHGSANILVATDVAARGIDVSGVDAVFNYDLPLEEEFYVHRIGRTGRAGKTGRAFTFIWGKDNGRLKDIQRYTKTSLVKGTIPTAEDMVTRQQENLAQQVLEIITNGGHVPFQNLAETLQEQGIEAKDMVAALLSLVAGNQEYKDIDFEGRIDDRDYGNRTERFGDRKAYQDRQQDRGYSRGGERGGDRFNDRRGRFEERGSRPERGDRPQRAPRTEGRDMSEGDFVKLYFGIGHSSRVRPGDLVGAIAGEAGLSGKAIGAIDIYDRHSHVGIPRDLVQSVIDAMDQNTIKGKRVKVGLAND